LQTRSVKRDDDSEDEMIKMMQMGLIRCLDTNEYSLVGFDLIEAEP
jgi:hypothetical protein